MAATYQILGKAVPSHHLSIATLCGVAYLAMPKPWAPAPPSHPTINASSAEEEKFIKDFLAKNLDEKKH